VAAVLCLSAACGGSEPEAAVAVEARPDTPELEVAPAPPAPVPTPTVAAPASTSGADASTGDSGDDPDATTGETAPDPLHGQLRPGESLSKILHRAGIGATEVHRVAEALQPVMDPATLKIGQRYAIELDESGALRSLALHQSVTEVARVTRSDEGRLTAKLEELPTERREEEIGGTVRSSLWAALTDRGHSPALVDVIVDVFAYDIDFFTATRAGDRFRLVVERHELDGELVRYGRVLVAEYDGEAAGKATVLWWDPPGGGAGRYVDAEGRGVARTLLKSPLKYARVSSGFNPKRMHPVLHRIKSHQGVDYAAPEGTPVWAAADGEIVFRAEKGGAGNLVILQHPGGLKTLYMHLSRFAPGQAVGDDVKAKTVIGYVGQTGLATGPHLHFGMQKHGRYVDPTTIESVRATGVAPGDRARFTKALARWQERLAAVATGEGESDGAGEDEVATDEAAGAAPAPADEVAGAAPAPP
jgi:murein DD-endopeptidase MepM/ murein hydrolase activator NlpD